jgi:competence protein ComGC
MWVGADEFNQKGGTKMEILTTILIIYLIWVIFEPYLHIKSVKKEIEAQLELLLSELKEFESDKKVLDEKLSKLNSEISKEVIDQVKSLNFLSKNPLLKRELDDVEKHVLKIEEIKSEEKKEKSIQRHKYLNEFLLKCLEYIQDELKEIRQEIRVVKRLLLQTHISVYEANKDSRKKVIVGIISLLILIIIRLIFSDPQLKQFLNSLF